MKPAFCFSDTQKFLLQKSEVDTNCGMEALGISASAMTAFLLIRLLRWEGSSRSS